ncbi:hypothetical protein GQ600_22201 [Phytophthora cactorum]|nr:hypothetical protein GQ600_22201 [Phytophthora cactorum]
MGNFLRRLLKSRVSPLLETYASIKGSRDIPDNFIIPPKDPWSKKHLVQAVYRSQLVVNGANGRGECNDECNDECVRDALVFFLPSSNVNAIACFACLIDKYAKKAAENEQDGAGLAFASGFLACVEVDNAPPFIARLATSAREYASFSKMPARRKSVELSIKQQAIEWMATIWRGRTRPCGGVLPPAWVAYFGGVRQGVEAQARRDTCRLRQSSSS